MCVYIYSSNPWESNYRGAPTDHKNKICFCHFSQLGSNN